MSEAKHTPGPWLVARFEARAFSARQPVVDVWESCHAGFVVYAERGVTLSDGTKQKIATEIAIPQFSEANANLIASAPELCAEMRRYLPVLERAESNPAVWEKLTAGLGIATANGYRAALTKATGGK